MFCRPNIFKISPSVTTCNQLPISKITSRLLDAENCYSKQTTTLFPTRSLKRWSWLFKNSPNTNTSWFLLHRQSITLHWFSNIPPPCDSQHCVRPELVALAWDSAKALLTLGLYPLGVIQKAWNQMCSFRYTVSSLIIVPRQLRQQTPGSKAEARWQKWDCYKQCELSNSLLW